MTRKVGKCEVEIKAVVPDPFELAMAIRRGEKDDELPDYEVITGWLQRVPVTWLPALMIHTIELCTIKKVFVDKAALLKIADRAAENAGNPLRGSE